MHELSKLTAALTAILLGLVCPCAGFAQGDAKDSGKTVVVHLRADAVVDEPIVTVAAVANLDGGEPWLRKKIGALDVAEVSRVGRSVVLSREQIALRIQLAGINSQSFRVEGPGQIMVKLNAIELTEEQIVKFAQQALLQRLKADAKDVDFHLLEPVHLPPVSLSPHDDLRFVMESQPPAIATPKTRIDIGVLVNGQRHGAATVLMEVSLYRHAVITTRRLEAHDLIQADCIRTERRAFRPGDNWLPYSDQLLAKQVVHSVSPGHIIVRADLSLPLDEDELIVKTRDNVKLVACVGNLRVITVGEAMQDGKLGQLIRVRNNDSGKIVVGRVVDRSTVEVDY